jgi:hypothetical protein
MPELVIQIGLDENSGIEIKGIYGVESDLLDRKEAFIEWMRTWEKDELIMFEPDEGTVFLKYQDIKHIIITIREVY